MATITAALVKELREKTGSGMMDCKTALTESNGEIEAAIAQELQPLWHSAQRVAQLIGEGWLSSELNASARDSNSPD